MKKRRSSINSRPLAVPRGADSSSWPFFIRSKQPFTRSSHRDTVYTVTVFIG